MRIEKERTIKEGKNQELGGNVLRGKSRQITNEGKKGKTSKFREDRFNTHVHYNPYYPFYSRPDCHMD